MIPHLDCSLLSLRQRETKPLPHATGPGGDKVNGWVTGWAKVGRNMSGNVPCIPFSLWHSGDALCGTKGRVDTQLPGLVITFINTKSSQLGSVRGERLF